MNTIEIKIRGWDDEEKKMYYFDLVNYMMTREDGQDELCSNHATQCLMLYTLLKDKKDEDIFGGDILKYDSWHPTLGKQTFIGEVVYNEGRACYCIEYMDGEYHYFGQEVFKVAMEVIGNIYENPELLNK